MIHQEQDLEKKTKGLLSLEEAKQLISRKLKELLESSESTSIGREKSHATNKLTEDSPILRFEVEVRDQEQNLLKWLANQQSKIKIYFSGRDAEDIEVAGIGIADEVLVQNSLDYEILFKKIRENLTKGNQNINYYGGIDFLPGSDEEKEWEDFGAIRFVLPRFELLNQNAKTYLACNVLWEKESKDGYEIKKEALEDILVQLEEIKTREFKEIPKPGRLFSRKDMPQYPQWKENIKKVLEEIDKGKLEKVVLARKVHLRFRKDQVLEPVVLLSALKKLPSQRYDFLFQVEEGEAFIGSSPERLYKRNGPTIWSEAVAGTRKRDQEGQKDDKLAKELMASTKEQLEHDFVLNTIETTLKPMCITLKKDVEKRLLKLKEGQHLISSFKGELKEGVTDEQLIKALHPTPAVGGCPLKQALETIQMVEPFKRGWYAGLMGRVGADDCDFTVGLRSGRIHKHSLFLYSGAGIVKGSIPEEEWQEVETKISNFMEILEGS